MQFYIAFPSFIVYSIPVLSLFLHSSLLPPRPPSSISARVEAGADSPFVIALRVTPVPCTRPRLPWGRTRHVAAYLQYLDIAAARHVVYPRVGAAGNGGNARYGTSLRMTTTPPELERGYRALALVRRARLIQTTSARKRAVTKGRREHEWVSSTAVRCAAHAHRAEETLDESTAYRRAAPHVPPGASRMGAVRQAGGERGRWR
ncbi:hypothetical protein B0H13DRAFT_993461 [Mycena leptocephala]|nr:hypothetical protein B0H13DRAFT_993461 [Mycena leptocephala]